MLLRGGVQPKVLILILILVRDGAGAAERDVKAPGRAQVSWRGMSGRKPLAVRAMDGAQMDGTACPRNGAGVEGTETKSRPSLSQMVWLLCRNKVTRRKGAKVNHHHHRKRIYTQSPRQPKTRSVKTAVTTQSVGTINIVWLGGCER